MLLLIIRYGVVLERSRAVISLHDREGILLAIFSLWRLLLFFFFLFSLLLFSYAVCSSYLFLNIDTELLVFLTQDGDSSVEIDGPEVPLLNAGSQSENYSVISAILP